MRRRVMLLVVGMTTLVVLAFAIPLAVLIRHAVFSDAVRGLEDKANTIAFFLRGDSGLPTVPQLRRYLADVSDGGSASVILPNGRLIGAAPPGPVPEAVTDRLSGEKPDVDSGPDADLRNPHDGPHGPFPGTPPQAVVVTYRGGELARLQVPSRDGLYTVSVYMTADQLNSGETPWWILLSAASAGLLIIGVLGGEVLTRRIVRPLDQTASTAQRLAAGDATARAPVQGPAEVAAVGRALNRLADRIDELIADERETVADLSHRLRTPLTAFRLDAESLRDPVEAERISAHAGVLERMLTAVIRAARRPEREGRMPACDATEVVRKRVAFWSALTEEQSRTADVSLPSGSLPVRAAAEDLGAAVDALLENVVAHTPEGTTFSVHLGPDDAGAVLEIGDSGPGMRAEAVVRGRSDRGSSGLGLDIARRCAEGTGGSMQLGRSATGGALVTLHLRAP